MPQEFDWKEKIDVLNEADRFVSESDVALFADSNLPNAFFLQHFLCPGAEPFCRKRYWRSFARVLISRGIERIADVKKELLIWLQDVNWPGSAEVFQFILFNLLSFQDEIKISMLEAVKTKDEAWFSALWLLLYQKQGLTEAEIAARLSTVSEILTADKGEEVTSNLIDEYFAKE